MNLATILLVIAIIIITSSIQQSTSMQTNNCPPSNSNENMILSSPTIIVVGLNAALQKRFILSANDKLIPGNVHRAIQVQTGIGGKGQDVAIALHCLLLSSPQNSKPSLSSSDKPTVSSPTSSIQQQLVQFIGTGSAGDLVYRMLQDRLGEIAMSLTVRSSKDLRTCTSIVTTDETTELVEPSGIISKQELNILYEKVTQIVHNQDIIGICIMGTMPPGCPSDTYAKLYKQMVQSSNVCVVDSVIGIDDFLQTTSNLGPSAGSIIFKINASEISKLAGTTKSKNESDGIEVLELIDAIQQFVAKYSPTIITTALLGLAITDGRHPAYFVSLEDPKQFSLYQIPISDLNTDQPLYPIGAGDAVAAGTIAAWVSLTKVDTIESRSNLCVPAECLESLQKCVKEIQQSNSVSLKGADAIASFSFGLVCGSASCLQKENSVLNTVDVIKLFQNVMHPVFLLKIPATKS